MKFNIQMATLILIGTAFAESASGQDVTFSTVDPGQDKAISEWGVEVAWINSWNLMQSTSHMGASEIDIIFANFWPKYALTGGGALSASAKADIDNQIAAASSLPNAEWAIGVDITGTDAYYFPGGTFSASRWHDMIDVSKDYYESASGKTVAYAMPFNEADFWSGTQGSPSDLNAVATLLVANTNFTGVGIMGPSTLSSYVAQADYDAAKVPLTHGSTHQLQTWGAGSADTTAAFYQYVASQGDTPYAPELHSLGEAVFSAEYGVEGGAWWAAVLRARGLFVRSCQGDRLGYAENRPNSSAAAVYRAPDGELYGFAGCFERMGAQTPYRFVCTDRDVYFNGIGPMREYVLPVNVNQDAFVNIDFGTNNILPALDGHRWKIKNRYTGDILTVDGAGTSNGDNVKTAGDVDVLHRQWDILRFKDGYYAIFNANSGKTLDVSGGSLGAGANVQQWGAGDAFPQFWYIESAGNGYYHIRNANSTLYLDGFNTSTIQWNANGETWQEWQFVLADPVGSGVPEALYEFEGNADDSVGSNDGVTTGPPTYNAHPSGNQWINLDGASDYVTLPSGIAASADCTIAAWVKWDGGDAWQRVFDFGSGTGSYMFLTPSAWDGTMRFAVTTNSNTEEEMLITDQLPMGQWIHLAITLSGNTGILYVDGSPKVAGHIELNPSDITQTANYIGKSQWPDPLFNGKIDDFQIYDYALDATHISELADVPPDASPPDAPAGLTAVSSDEQITLSWNAVADATDFAVQCSLIDGGPYSVVDSTVATNYVHGGLTNGITYYYVVSSSGVRGDSTNSLQVSAVPSAAITSNEFHIADMAISGGTQVSLTVSNTVPGHDYGLLATENLISAVWSNILTEAGTGSDLMFDVPIDPAITNRYFKLDVQRQ